MLRLATYNIEWFSNLFDDDNALIRDSSWSARHNVTKSAQAKAISTVLREIDADATMIIEAPDTSPTRDGVTALQNFAQTFNLRTRRAITGFANTTQQEIALLYDPDKLSAQHDPQSSPQAPRFDQSFPIDLDIDAREDDVVFSKPPLELAVTLASGKSLRLIGAHLKSKASHGAKNEPDIMQLSIANRRKQLAQCIWLRHRIEQHLSASQPIIVAGDFNDGPGLDHYEKLFGQSGVEIIMGTTAPGDMRLHNPHAEAALSHRLGAMQSTSRFYLRDEGIFLNALLDYIMVSPDLMPHQPKWRILHPFDNAKCWRDERLRNALLAASDHFPVVLDIDL